MSVYVDENFINQLCDIPHLSTDTLLFVHLFKKDNILPKAPDAFTPWAAYAEFSHLEMPPPVGTLCRSGQQFRGYSNPIIMYEAGIGTSRLATDVQGFKEVIQFSLSLHKHEVLFRLLLSWFIIN